MATYGRTMRRGLPRQSGGEPWPPAGTAVADQSDDARREPSPGPGAVRSDRVSTLTAPPPEETTTAPPPQPTTTAPPLEDMTTALPPQPATPAGAAARTMRRGLPRSVGGDPWPPAVKLPAAASSAPVKEDQAEVETTAAPATDSVELPGKPTVPAPTDESPSGPKDIASAPAATAAVGSTLLRRGLPRVSGGDPWPPETAVVIESLIERKRVAAPTTQEGTETSGAQEEAKASAPLPQPPASRADPKPTKSTNPKKPRSRTAILVFGALGLLGVALAAVFFTRWLVTLDFMRDFLTAYPGETALPAGTDPGFPAWAQWQHFFNFFLIVLIIRSGLQVRRETRPPGYWTPKWSKGSDGKISITSWFHQTLDVLWLLNGLIFVVLLFVTGHWARLVPITWEVIPNALSAMIQYVSLDWPTENGWVNYNSLQMLAYFVTVFIAAPLAAISGARMSGIWPKDAKTLNRLYPIEWARAIHFPVMLYFVVFIIGHVALVFATGALRNLNHMYGGQDAVNWTGFWIFFGSLLLVIGAWIAARPVVLAPLAGLFGRVSSR